MRSDTDAGGSKGGESSEGGGAVFAVGTSADASEDSNRLIWSFGDLAGVEAESLAV